MLGTILCIMSIWLGIKMIYDSKILNDDNDEMKSWKVSHKKTGVLFIVIGGITNIFIIVMEVIKF